MSLQQEISYEHTQQLVGKTIKVMVEGYLFEDDYIKNKELVFKYKFNAAHPKYVFLNEKEINDYLKRGIDVNTWTVNDFEIKDFLADEGVKVIITNRDI